MIYRFHAVACLLQDKQNCFWRKEKRDILPSLISPSIFKT